MHTSFVLQGAKSKTRRVMEYAISRRTASKFTRVCWDRKKNNSRKAFSGFVRNRRDTFSASTESRARSFPIRLPSNPICSSPKVLNSIDRSYSISNSAAKGGGQIESETNYSHLLTKATALQLKGDIDEALVLANRALSIQKNFSTNGTGNEQNEEIADTLLFLGKLNLLNGSIENAVELFSESRDLIKQQQQCYRQLPLRKEYVAPPTAHTKNYTHPRVNLESTRFRIISRVQFHRDQVRWLE